MITEKDKEELIERLHNCRLLLYKIKNKIDTLEVADKGDEYLKISSELVYLLTKK
jgi:hypothetical protein